jgi:hypothetical protein
MGTLQRKLEKANLRIDKIVYDSGEFQFWASEQYIRNIPFTDTHSYYHNKESSIFSSSQISEFKKKAIELNQKKLGDSCAFFLREKE